MVDAWPATRRRVPGCRIFLVEIERRDQTPDPRMLREVQAPVLLQLRPRPRITSSPKKRTKKASFGGFLVSLEARKRKTPTRHHPGHQISSTNADAASFRG